MILKNDVYFWKIDYELLKTDIPFSVSDEPDFIEIFLTFDMLNNIMKDIGILYRKNFYDII